MCEPLQAVLRVHGVVLATLTATVDEFFVPAYLADSNALLR